jgi:hypothetical protein
VYLVICPGFHEKELTAQLMAWLNRFAEDYSCDCLIFPVEQYPAYSAFHLLDFLYQQPNTIDQPLVFIAFSAGVVAAIGAATVLQVVGKSVQGLIAIDGWGVPLTACFPIYRLSHDYFTHWSSALLGAGQESFYADPPVEHLQMWRSPQTVQGWWVRSQQTSISSKSPSNLWDQSDPPQATTAGEFILNLLTRSIERSQTASNQ